MLRYLRYMLRIRRVEFRIAEIPILAIPLLLLLRDTTPLTNYVLWEGILIFFLLFAFGDMINCLADRDLDAVYKPHLSEAVYGLGIPFVTFQVVATAVLALILSLHLSQVLNRWLLSVMVAIGLALGAAYSVKPFQIKGRGLAQVPCLWLIIFVGPMLFIAYLLDANLSLAVLIFGAAFGTLQMGIILVNTAEDYPEDIEAGIKTSIVAVGLHRGIGLAFWLVAIGAMLVEGTLVILMRQRGASEWWMLALVPSVVAAVYVLMGVGQLRQSIKSASLQESILKVKHAAKRVPVWITLVAWSTLGATYTIFYVSRTHR